MCSCMRAAASSMRCLLLVGDRQLYYSVHFHQLCCPDCCILSEVLPVGMIGSVASAGVAVFAAAPAYNCSGEVERMKRGGE